jgi:hypothetical protein
MKHALSASKPRGAPAKQNAPARNLVRCGAQCSILATAALPPAPCRAIFLLVRRYVANQKHLGPESCHQAIGFIEVETHGSEMQAVVQAKSRRD